MKNLQIQYLQDFYVCNENYILCSLSNHVKNVKNRRFRKLNHELISKTNMTKMVIFSTFFKNN